MDLLSEDGISPVIAIILLVSITVAAVALASTIVFNTGTVDHEHTGPASVSVSQNTNGSVRITVWSMNSEKIVVKHNETKYNLTKEGSSITLNPSSDNSLVILSKSDRSASVIRMVTFDSEFINQSAS